MKSSKNFAKASNRALKAVAQVDQCVNKLNEFGVYDIERAKRRAKSFLYWIAKK